MLSDALVDAFASRIELWKKANKGQHPNRIVIFRDGVSEGQYSLVLDVELPMLREACRKTCPPKDQPQLTVIVSVKRHQTRFFPSDSTEMTRSGNIKNGTVVDRGITQARYWDFYLTAHDALKGTARPAHYTVLLDEIFRQRFKGSAADELEKLTHELCYLYGRATKAVSICPPAYYADIVCERARAHRPEDYDASDAVSMGSGSTAPRTSNRQIHPALRDTMYYM
jgi:eukaryotic translation initiation factor 2C